MKRYNDQSPRLQKWGLFILLAGSVGFSLSMNPEHYNNIVRNEGPWFSVDLAQEADPASETAKGTKSAATSSGTAEAPKKRSFIQKFDNTVCVVDVEQEGSILKGELKTATEAKPCKHDKKVVVFKKAKNLSDLEAISAEIEDIASAMTGSGSTEEKKVIQKAGEATEVDLEKWAAKCDKVSDSSKLSCHKTRLIELSKYLKNNSDMADKVDEYFRNHLFSEIKSGLQTPTIREMSADRCEGTPVYQSTFNRVGCESSEALEEANSLSEEIIKGLRATNGKKVVEQLIRARAGSFSAQLRNSQSLAIRGFQDGNRSKFQYGIAGLDPNQQMQLLDMANSGMLDAIRAMPGATAQTKSAYDRVLENAFYSPVSNLIDQLRQATMAPGGTSLETSQLFTMTIPRLGYDNMSGTGTIHIGGENITLGNRSARGANLQFSPLANPSVGANPLMRSFDQTWNQTNPALGSRGLRQ